MRGARAEHLSDRLVNSLMSLAGRTRAFLHSFCTTDAILARVFFEYPVTRDFSRSRRDAMYSCLTARVVCVMSEMRAGAVGVRT